VKYCEVNVAIQLAYVRKKNYVQMVQNLNVEYDVSDWVRKVLRPSDVSRRCTLTCFLSYLLSYLVSYILNYSLTYLLSYYLVTYLIRYLLSYLLSYLII